MDRLVSCLPALRSVLVLPSEANGSVAGFGAGEVDPLRSVLVLPSEANGSVAGLGAGEVDQIH